jgi:hypothetical protein
MQYLYIPKASLSHLNALNSRFLWGTTLDGKDRIHFRLGMKDLNFLWLEAAEFRLNDFKRV